MGRHKGKKALFYSCSLLLEIMPGLLEWTVLAAIPVRRCLGIYFVQADG